MTLSEVIYRGSVEDEQLAIRAVYEEDETTTTLRITSPCCLFATSYVQTLKVECNNCKKTYPGYTDNEIQVHNKDRITQWLTAWLRIENEEDIEVTIKW
jgi:hypothetical protein